MAAGQSGSHSEQKLFWPLWLCWRSQKTQNIGGHSVSSTPGSHVLGLDKMRWSYFRWLLLCHRPPPECKTHKTYRELGFRNRFYLDATPGCLGLSTSLSSDDDSSLFEDTPPSHDDFDDSNMVRQDLVEDYFEVRVARCTNLRYCMPRLTKGLCDRPF